MDLEVKVSCTVDEDWDRNLSQNVASTAFQVSKLNEFYQATGSKPVFVLIKNSNKVVGQLAAAIFDKILWHDSNLLSKTIGQKFNLRRALTWSYGPIIHDVEHSYEILSKIFAALEEISIKHKVVMIKGTSQPIYSPIPEKLLDQLNYTTTKRSTYIIDLKQDANILYGLLDKKTRHDIRKSEESDLEFVVANDRSDIDMFTELKTNERRRANEKIETEPPHYNDNRWKYLGKDGYEKIFFAYYNGKPVAGILNTMFNGNVIQKRVSVGLKTHPLAGTFLTWRTIKWCIDQKYSTYDMGGINPAPINDKEKSIAFYKSKWGGEKVDYLEFTKLVDPLKWKVSSILKDPLKLKKIL